MFCSVFCVWFCSYFELSSFSVLRYVEWFDFLSQRFSVEFAYIHLCNGECAFSWFWSLTGPCVAAALFDLRFVPFRNLTGPLNWNPSFPSCSYPSFRGPVEHREPPSQSRSNPWGSWSRPRPSASHCQPCQMRSISSNQCCKFYKSLVTCSPL